MRSLNGSARALVDVAAGEISREIFVNPDIYREEQERVFSRAWLYIGHESQIRAPGDFVVSRMGEESVILTRDRDRHIHVFLNSCRHRGMKVCRYDDGNTRSFICPYHAWSYDLDGRLIGVQDYENSYRPPFDKTEWGLIEAAQTANLRGTIWATWDGTAPSFDDYLGAARFALDLGLRPWDGGDGETEVLGSTQKWIVPCNWKFIAENFAGDALHVVTHRSVDLVGIGPSKGPGRRDDYGKPYLAAYPGGHGVNYGVTPPVKERHNYAASPATAAYFQSTWERRVARLGDKAGIVPLIGTIFPNMSFHLQQPRTILVSHPRGPCETEMWRVYLVDKDAPDAVKRYLRSYYTRYSGPAGMTEQDDMENWNYATDASRGAMARRHPYNYKSCLGSEAGRSDFLPGFVTERNTTEQNPRALYKRWAEYMDADDWRALAP
jgi:phenylpropionate dioxygenase-like ring-hydroxylating dioxygenase large terminal subunit